MQTESVQKALNALKAQEAKKNHRTRTIGELLQAKSNGKFEEQRLNKEEEEQVVNTFKAQSGGLSAQQIVNKFQSNEAIGSWWSVDSPEAPDKVQEAKLVDRFKRFVVSLLARNPISMVMTTADALTGNRAGLTELGYVLSAASYLLLPAFFAKYLLTQVWGITADFLTAFATKGGGAYLESERQESGLWKGKLKPVIWDTTKTLLYKTLGGAVSFAEFLDELTEGRAHARDAVIAAAGAAGIATGWIKKAVMDVGSWMGKFWEEMKALPSKVKALPATIASYFRTIKNHSIKFFQDMWGKIKAFFGSKADIAKQVADNGGTISLVELDEQHFIGSSADQAEHLAEDATEKYFRSKNVKIVETDKTFRVDVEVNDAPQPTPQQITAQKRVKYFEKIEATKADLPETFDQTNAQPRPVVAEEVKHTAEQIRNQRLSALVKNDTVQHQTAALAEQVNQAKVQLPSIDKLASHGKGGEAILRETINARQGTKKPFEAMPRARPLSSAQRAAYSNRVHTMVDLIQPEVPPANPPELQPISIPANPSPFSMAIASAVGGIAGGVVGALAYVNNKINDYRDKVEEEEQQYKQAQKQYDIIKKKPKAAFGKNTEQHQVEVNTSSSDYADLVQASADDPQVTAQQLAEIYLQQKIQAKNIEDKVQKALDKTKRETERVQQENQLKLQMREADKRSLELEKEQQERQANVMSKYWDTDDQLTQIRQEKHRLEQEEQKWRSQLFWIEHQRKKEKQQELEEAQFKQQAKVIDKSGRGKTHEDGEEVKVDMNAQPFVDANPISMADTRTVRENFMQVLAMRIRDGADLPNIDEFNMNERGIMLAVSHANELNPNQVFPAYSATEADAEATDIIRQRHEYEVFWHSEEERNRMMVVLNDIQQKAPLTRPRQQQLRELGNEVVRYGDAIDLLIVTRQQQIQADQDLENVLTTLFTDLDNYDQVYADLEKQFERDVTAHERSLLKQLEKHATAEVQSNLREEYARLIELHNDMLQELAELMGRRIDAQQLLLRTYDEQLKLREQSQAALDKLQELLKRFTIADYTLRMQSNDAGILPAPSYLGGTLNIDRFVESHQQ